MNNEEADVEGNFNMMVMPSIAYFYNNNEFGESVYNNKKTKLKKKCAKVKIKERKTEIEIENKTKEKYEKESNEVKEINKRDNETRDAIATFHYFIRVKIIITGYKMRSEINEVMNEKNTNCAQLQRKLRLQMQKNMLLMCNMEMFLKN